MIWEVVVVLEVVIIGGSIGDGGGIGRRWCLY